MTTSLRLGIRFYRTEQCLWVYVSYLSKGFLDIGIKKNTKDSIGKGIFDCFQRATEIALLFTDWPPLPPVFGLVFRRNTNAGSVPSTDTLFKFLTLLHKTFTWIYRKYAKTNSNNSSICLVFVVFRGKVWVSRFTQKPFGLRHVFKAYPRYEATSISSKQA